VSDIGRRVLGDFSGDQRRLANRVVIIEEYNGQKIEAPGADRRELASTSSAGRWSEPCFDLEQPVIPGSNVPGLLRIWGELAPDVGRDEVLSVIGGWCVVRAQNSAALKLAEDRPMPG